MKIDCVLRHASVDQIRDGVTTAEQQGYAAAWTTEEGNDPFLPLMIAAEHSTGIELGTAIAVAFARNPMTTAYTAWDLQRHSGGRFLLGLGSQVRAHVERRFGMPWSHPARRMREFVLALRAIWAGWETGQPIAFDGEFYRHTLMTPFFTPPPLTCDVPQIWLAAVGPEMTAVAGEVCDGLLVHPFTTVRYLDEQLLPTLAAGAERTGGAVSDIALSLPCFVVTGVGDEAEAARRERVRERIAFYGSTPAYRGVLAVHGWDELGEELHALSRAADDDRWTRMARLVPDEVVEAFAVCGPLDRIARLLADRYAGRIDRLTLNVPDGVPAPLWAEVLTDLRAATEAVVR